ncbi:hypothetical protein E4U54_001457 [Claviceps lovelessii]|nr:hypothetical protein E4U54_001457 [Claviceps lovelessii]
MDLLCQHHLQKASIGEGVTQAPPGPFKQLKAAGTAEDQPQENFLDALISLVRNQPTCCFGCFGWLRNASPTDRPDKSDHVVARMPRAQAESLASFTGSEKAKEASYSYDGLPELRLPVLVAHGTSDPDCFLQYAAKLCAASDNAIVGSNLRHC